MKDHLGNTIDLKTTPQRIVSLVPSQTELVVDLGMRDAIVGVTKFCVHPKNLRKETQVVGGTKNVNFDKIKKLVIKFNHSQAIEDIANLDENAKKNVFQNRMLLQQINKAIVDKKLNKNEIEL